MDRNSDLSQLRKLAQSPAGLQLLRMLQQSGGENLQKAMAAAAKGDYTDAKQQLSSLLANPEAQRLLKQLEDSQ